MANTYTLINKNKLTSSASSFTFTSIPSTYTDLVLRVSARSNPESSYASNLLLTFNSDNTSNYSSISVQGPIGTNSIFTGASTNFNQIPGTLVESNTFGSSEFYIFSYSSSTFKRVQSFSSVEINSSTNYSISNVEHLWSNSAAISSIKIETSTASMIIGSSFYLYGISNA
jgi:hypothetical protein